MEQATMPLGASASTYTRHSKRSSKSMEVVQNLANVKSREQEHEFTFAKKSLEDRIYKS